LWQPLAEQGDPDAQAGLGNLYLGGYGVARDEAAAMTWFRKWFAVVAARGADSYARTNAVKGRDATAMKMTPAQVAEAERLVREWKPKLAR
jgi:uncharacterized protein